MAKINFDGKFRSKGEMKELIKKDVADHGKCLFDVHAHVQFAYLIDKRGNEFHTYAKNNGIVDKKVYNSLNQAIDGIFNNLNIPKLF